MSVDAGAAQVPTPAMRHIRPPERLHLGENAVKHWKIFRQRWESYALISGVDTMELPKQKALFIHCLEDEALEAYNTFQLNDTSTLKDVLDSFEKFVIGECNETYERFMFNNKVQEPGEKFELFYADLQRLIKTCNYCQDCEKSILRDRIVLGVNDTTVQKTY